jgi:hypothetical protein
MNVASLEDPAGFLQGKGKLHMHVKLFEVDQVQNPDFLELLLSALHDAQKR